MGLRNVEEPIWVSIWSPIPVTSVCLSIRWFTTATKIQLCEQRNAVRFWECVAVCVCLDNSGPINTCKRSVEVRSVMIFLYQLLDNRLWSWYERPRFKASEAEKCPRLTVWGQSGAIFCSVIILQCLFVIQILTGSRNAQFCCYVFHC